MANRHQRYQREWEEYRKAEEAEARRWREYEAKLPHPATPAEGSKDER